MTTQKIRADKEFIDWLRGDFKRNVSLQTGIRELSDPQATAVLARAAKNTQIVFNKPGKRGKRSEMFNIRSEEFKII